LLSSQTTDTPGTTTTTQPWIAPEQLFKLTRFRGALQISVSAISISTRWVPAVIQHANLRTILRLFIRGSVAIFPHQRRRLELLYTAPGQGTNQPQRVPGVAESPNLRGIRPAQTALGPSSGAPGVCGPRHMKHHSQPGVSRSALQLTGAVGRDCGVGFLVQRPYEPQEVSAGLSAVEGIPGSAARTALLSSDNGGRPASLCPLL
ncbi:hypothetical protein ABIB51_004092, partial [Arthrobacter sp. UYCu712]